jgi:hypothetical protein
MMGFAWGMGSLFVPLIGASADTHGIERTLVALAFVPLLAASLAYRLPESSPPPSATHTTSPVGPEPGVS